MRVDAYGLAAGLAVDPAASLHLAALSHEASADPARPSRLELRWTMTSAAGAFGTPLCHTRAELVLRLDPLSAPGPVAARGGGLAGARSALAAALARLHAMLDRSRVRHHVLRARDVTARLTLGTRSPDRSGPHDVRSARSSAGTELADPGDAGRVLSAARVAGARQLLLVLRVDLRDPQLRCIGTLHAGAGDAGQVVDAVALLGGRPARGRRPAAVPGWGEASSDSVDRLLLRGRARRGTGPPACTAFGPPAGGALLGADRRGTAAVYPLFGPLGTTRVGVVDDLVATRALAGAILRECGDLTVITRRPEVWSGLCAGGRPAVVTDRVRGWPAWPGRPCGVVVDMPQPPSLGFTDAPWSCVVHLAPTAPRDDPWWQASDLLLAPWEHVRAAMSMYEAHSRRGDPFGTSGKTGLPRDCPSPDEAASEVVVIDRWSATPVRLASELVGPPGAGPG